MQTFGRPFWGSSWSPCRRLQAISKTQGITVGKELWPYPVLSSAGAVHMLSWCLSVLENADFASRHYCLYWPNLHQLQWELRCLDLIWIPNVRCQNFVVLISPCVYWIRSHRPQVEKGTITMSCASQQSPRCCFLLRTLKTQGSTSPPGQCVLWKSSVVRTQRLQSTDQKSYSEERRNSWCQATTLIQPPCTLPLWYYLTQFNI